MLSRILASKLRSLHGINIIAKFMFEQNVRSAQRTF